MREELRDRKVLVREEVVNQRDREVMVRESGRVA